MHGSTKLKFRAAGLRAEIYVLLYELILNKIDMFDKVVPYFRAARPSATIRTAVY